MNSFSKSRRSKKSETADEDIRLPIKLDTTSNGEYQPRPLGEKVRFAKQLAIARSEETRCRLGVTRRQFMLSSCGVATTLLCLNEVMAFGRSDKELGGYFNIHPLDAIDEERAARIVRGTEFIFDIQTHHVNPMGAWRQTNPAFAGGFLIALPQARCGERDYVNCFSRDYFIKDVFMDSDTSVAVLTQVPAVPGTDPLPTDEAATTRSIVETMFGSPRLQIHGIVVPNIQTQMQLDGMQRLAEQLKIKAWKCYTHFGPNGVGWFLDDPRIGIPFIEKARQLGVKNICIHKGLSGNSFYATCRDVGIVAKAFPDMTFLIYHSGYESIESEGPYNPSSSRGIDTLIKSLEDNQVPPNSNVYAELGSTWRQVMTSPTRAAHVIGKLLKYVGENRVVWGTDSIWYGSPQDQIQAFRAFQITSSFQQQFGYPELTPEIKAKVFGRNAAVPYGLNLSQIASHIASDDIAKLKLEYQENPQPSFRTLGPRNRREFMELLRYQSL